MCKSFNVYVHVFVVFMTVQDVIDGWAEQKSPACAAAVTAGMYVVWWER